MVSFLLRTVDGLQAALMDLVGSERIVQVIFALSVFLSLFSVLLFIRFQILSRLMRVAKMTPTKIDDVVTDQLLGIRTPVLFLVSVYVGGLLLDMPTIVEIVVRGVFLAALVYEFVRIGEGIIVYLITNRSVHSPEARNATMAISVITRFILWTAGILLILSNLGLNVTSLVASLGIGGLAVSLALQNVLTDVFSSFSIIMDKPFEPGDFITVGDQMGTVKSIGLKTTRIEALEGEEIIISNTELTNARIQNYKKLQTRRVEFTVSISRETPLEKVRRLPEIIHEVINGVKRAEFHRAHLARIIGTNGMEYEVVYMVHAPEYGDYMEVQQSINFGILERLAKEGIALPTPRQEVFVRS